MHTLTLEVTHNNALKTLTDLEKKQYIRIVQQADIDSPALPGAPLSIEAFKRWITNAERKETVDLKEAKSRWEGKKKQLLKLAR